MSFACTWGAVELAAEGDTVNVSSLDLARLLQIAQPMRGAAAKPVNRGNQVHTLRFTNTRPPHANVAAAIAFLISHAAAIQAVGATTDIEMTLGGVDYVLSNAALQRVSARHIGLTTIHDYELVFGTIAEAP
ncbi:MAG: hypothetical protein C0518_05585 [Opitutus sp.]|nr:hypothetical protein [Opitutus sp.]